MTPKRTSSPSAEASEQKRSKTTKQTASSKTASDTSTTDDNIVSSSSATDNKADSSAKDDDAKALEIAKKNLQNDSSPSLAIRDQAICIRTVLPFTTHVITDEDQIRDYDNIMQGRIQIMSTFKNEKANIYALPNLLPTATWGPYHPQSSDDRSKTLCNPATGDAITVWILGHITRVAFTWDNAPAKQASISVALLSKQLSRQTANVLALLCDPPQATINQGWANVRATRWQSSRLGNGTNTQPVLFNGVYDARGKLEPKSKMENYSPLELKHRDHVLVEAKLKRYNIRAENRWTSHTQFEFQAINLIHASDVNAVEEVEEDKPAEIDDLCI